MEPTVFPTRGWSLEKPIAGWGVAGRAVQNGGTVCVACFTDYKFTNWDRKMY